MKALKRNGHVLLVEDNPGDVFLAQEAWERAGLVMPLHVASDGEEAIAFLKREGDFADAPRPDLLILDLNLPRKSGREVLGEVMQNPRTAGLAVAILTTSTTDWHICDEFGIDRCAYFVKPPQFPELVKIMQQISALMPDTDKPT